MNAPSNGYMGGDSTGGGDRRPKHLTKQEFARRLKALLIHKEWSQSDLARRAGLTRDAVSTYCRGASFPTEKNLEKLSKALDVPSEQLLPNKVEMSIDYDTPSMSMKESASYPGKTWLQINRLVRTKTALKVMMLMDEDDAGSSD